MSTRCTIEFKSRASFKNNESYTIFKHWDGYPENILPLIEAASTSNLVWKLPRYEPDEFAAGFIAFVKTCSGDIRLAKNKLDFGDTDFHYIVSICNDRLYIEIQEPYKEFSTLNQGFLTELALHYSVENQKRGIKQ